MWFFFQEYKPSETNGQADDQKKRKPEETLPVSEVIIPVKKQRVAHVSTDAPARPSTLAPQKPPQRLTPGMMMIDRFKKLQESKAANETQSWPQPSSTLNRMTSPFPTSSGGEKKRIAHVPNVMGLLTSKGKVTPTTNSSPAVNTSLPTGQPKTYGNPLMRKPLPTANKPPPTPSTTTKLPRPMIAIELGCRVAASIRQKYLNILVDETLKIYDREEDAFERAVEEEKQSYAKCSSKLVYVNIITNVVQRIRREAESNKPTSTNQGGNNAVQFYYSQ